MLIQQDLHLISWSLLLIAHAHRKCVLALPAAQEDQTLDFLETHFYLLTYSRSQLFSVDLLGPAKWKHFAKTATSCLLIQWDFLSRCNHSSLQWVSSAEVMQQLLYLQMWARQPAALGVWGVGFILVAWFLSRFSHLLFLLNIEAFLHNTVLLCVTHRASTSLGFQERDWSSHLF